MLKSIQKLQELSPYEISLLIKNNHPQIIAQICYHLDDKVAADVLTQLTCRLREDVMLRISTLYDADTFWLNKLDTVLTYLVDNKSTDLIFQSGGKKASAILSCMPERVRDMTIDSIREYDPEHCDKLVDDISSMPSFTKDE